MPKEKKIRIVEIAQQSTPINIETNNGILKGNTKTIEYQILDEKDNRASLTRTELIERLDKYTDKLDSGTRFQVNVYFENIGWRSVKGGGIIIAHETLDIGKYIYGDSARDSDYVEEIGDVLAFEIVMSSKNILKSK